jgi:hypothetical protein
MSITEPDKWDGGPSRRLGVNRFLCFDYDAGWGGQSMTARRGLFAIAIGWFVINQAYAGETKLFASEGKWQVVQSVQGKTPSCLIQSIYDGHSQIAFGLFGPQPTTEIFVYANELAMPQGSRGRARLRLVGLQRNAVDRTAPYVVPTAHLARISTGSSVYQKMLTLLQNSDSLHIDLAASHFDFALAGTVDIMPYYMKCLNKLP